MKYFRHLSPLLLFLFSSSSFAVEITPLLGLRGGGDFVDTNTEKNHTVESSESFGLIASFPYVRGKKIEIYYSHQSSNINSVDVNLSSTTGNVNIPLVIDYLHIGGTTPISEVMTRDCTTVDQHALAAEALKIMQDKKINGALITDKDNRLVGALNMHDLLRAGVLSVVYCHSTRNRLPSLPARPATVE